MQQAGRGAGSWEDASTRPVVGIQELLRAPPEDPFARAAVLPLRRLQALCSSRTELPPVSPAGPGPIPARHRERTYLKTGLFAKRVECQASMFQAIRTTRHP